MAVSSVNLHSLFSITPNSPKCCYQIQTLPLPNSHFLSPKSISRLRKQSLFSNIQIKNRKPRSGAVVFAAQSNIVKVLQTVWKVGKDGIEAGTDLVPDSVPRPVARISVTVVAATVALFVVKSFLSTAFFVLGMVGLIYFIFIALNKDEGPRGGGGGGGGGGGTTSPDDSLAEARRIMEKYK